MGNRTSDKKGDGRVMMFLILFIGLIVGTILAMIAACLSDRYDTRRVDDESNVDDSTGAEEDSDETV